MNTIKKEIIKSRIIDAIEYSKEDYGRRNCLTCHEPDDELSRIFWSRITTRQEFYVIPYISRMNLRDEIYLHIDSIDQLEKSISRDKKIEKILGK